MKKGLYHIGPRKVVSNGLTALVYLGKDFQHLTGRKVMLVVKVLNEESENKET